MKKHRLTYIFLSLGILSLLVSCNNETDSVIDTPLPEGQYPVEFSASNFVMPVTTRSLTDNCVVSVTMTDNIPTISDANKNYVYRASDNTLRAQASPRYWSDANQILTVRAYYPVGATIGNITDQSSIGQYHHFDVLYATNTIAFNEREIKALTFSHLMSRVEIRLALKNSYTSSDIQSVQIANTITQGTLNNWNTSSTPSAGTSGGTRGYITSCAYEITSDTIKYQAVVIPQTVTASSGSPVSLIYVALNQNSRTYYMPLTANLTFEAGKTYTYTIDIN